MLNRCGRPVLILAGCLAPGCGVEDLQTEPEVDPVEICAERPACAEPFCEQVLIEAGEFMMGSNHGPHADAYWPSGDERPRHAVQLDSFCIDKYEVSLQRYEACVDAGACTPEGLLWRSVQTVVNHYPPECDQDRSLCALHAVNAKNYRQARSYCKWIGGRLCTEAQWERAANGPGPDRRRNPWGHERPSSDLVNIPSVGTGFVEAVDDYAAGQSAEGVFNLAGNVYEWVEDAYGPYEVGPGEEPILNPSHPPSPGDDVVGRGSCFFTEPVHTVAERTIFPMDFDWG